MNNRLVIIMPVFNEAKIIKTVLLEWIKVLNSLKINYKIKVFNDGSTDSTLDVLTNIKKEYPSFISVINQQNSGHGPTILSGYKNNLDSDWIFQVDSDNEMKAIYFKNLWDKKDDFDFIIGKRTNRKSPLIRKIMTYVSYLIVKLYYGKNVKDVNCPYRLMRSKSFINIINDLPNKMFAPNITITGMAIRKKLKVKQINIPFQERTTGINSLNLNAFKLLKISYSTFNETIHYANYKKNK